MFSCDFQETFGYFLHSFGSKFNFCRNFYFCKMNSIKIVKLFSKRCYSKSTKVTNFLPLLVFKPPLYQVSWNHHEINCTRDKFVMLCVAWYHSFVLKNVKNTHGGVLLLVKLQANACNFTRSKTPPWVFFTFFKLYEWHQIAQSTTKYCVWGNFFLERPVYIISSKI